MKMFEMNNFSFFFKSYLVLFSTFFKNFGGGNWRQAEA